MRKEGKKKERCGEGKDHKNKTARWKKEGKKGYTKISTTKMK
jgi:hypothetical protein